MQDSLIVVGGFTLASVLFGVEEAVGVPGALNNISALGIVGFTVWYTLTQTSRRLDALAAAITELTEKIDGIPTIEK